ncbi:MAG TPA: LysR family transcriptional regulator [Polyangiaceae bacterium]|nr:LysR family transcriptional regulator [Polyangiaceae bacterium]
MLQPRDLPLLAVFAAVARHGSFTAAARELGLSKSVVSEHVRTLEARCGVGLLERSTRRVQLTQVGGHVLRAADAVVDAARDVGAILSEHRDAPVGELRVSTSHDLGARFVVPVAARLAVEHPQLRVDVVSDDAVRDLIGGGFDLSVRLGAPADSGHILRRLGTMLEHVVAAPALLDAFGPVARPRDLAGAPWVRHSLVTRTNVWRFRGPRGEHDEIAVTPRAQANTAGGLVALLLSGLGFGVLPELMLGPEARRGALVKVCPEWHHRSLAIYALLPSAKPPKRVSLFLAALREELARSELDNA